MVDTGAAVTTVIKKTPGSTFSGKTLSTIGFSGIRETQPYTDNIDMTFGRQRVKTPVLVVPSCPINLLARDILTKLGITIQCSEKGLRLTYPGDTIRRGGQFIVMTPSNASEDSVEVSIFWSRLLYDEPGPGLIKQFFEWRASIPRYGDYHYPLDPMHVTLNYTIHPDQEYEERWDSLKEGKTETIHCPFIFVGKEGIAAMVVMTEEQMEWFCLGVESVPHVTLGIAKDHHARQLGPMVKEAIGCEYRQTEIPGYSTSEGGKFVRLNIEAWDQVVNEKVERDRAIEGENIDHRDSDKYLSNLSPHIWTTGPYDVGVIKGEVFLELANPGQKPIWRKQYRLSPSQEEGIKGTIEGLMESGVLRAAPDSMWNTPIMPVPKPGRKDWRMVHDLREINLATKTIGRPVPDPYVALRALSPEHEYYTVIDLANAFFCLKLAEECQDWFTFTYQAHRYTYTRLPQGYKDSPGLFNQALSEILMKLKLPEDVTLIQYVDDLLLAGKTPHGCLTGQPNRLLVIMNIYRG
ncbi:uncharacterized protein [Narcine bancroftii]|uniref:uncharacterized protein n=1 Tax=Narcine bancroftii TaxID=1343680 RepID=UPI003831E07A